MYKVVAIISLLSLFFIAPIYAQTEDATLSPDIAISMAPTNPLPGQSIVLEVTSYTTDLNQATITWRYNNTIISTGVGKVRVATTAPQAGTVATISASISGAGAPLATASILVRTATVDLLWEAADSYVPPFYKGKALVAPNGLIKTTAITTNTSPKNASYQWSQNDSVIDSASGYNRTSMVFKNTILKSQEHIGVSVRSGSFTGESETTITPVTPGLYIYRNKDGFIDYTNGYTTGVSTTASGLSLRFEPYFFSIPTDLTKDLVFDIKNGDISIPTNEQPNEISISAPDTKGESVLDITITTAMYSLQNVLRHFKILFN